MMKTKALDFVTYKTEFGIPQIRLMYSTRSEYDPWKGERENSE